MSPRATRRPAPTSRPRAAFLVWRDTENPEGGGSELFVERVAEGMVRDGWDVTICSADYPGAKRDDVRAGVAYRRRGGRLTVYLRGLAYLLGPGRHADVVVDVQNGLPFFSPLVRRRSIVALVHHVHREQWHIVYPGLFGHVGWWVESRLAPRLFRSRPYVTVSEATRRDLVALGVTAERIRVVHNGLDVPHPAHVQPRAAEPTLCVLGRLVPHKQVEHALAAAAAARRSVANLRVEIVGDGWWREHLQAYAQQLGVDDIVTFHGHVTDAERDAVLDRSWVLLAPSVKEGWGIAIMEAAARGVPAIAYRSAGGVCESIVDGDTGWLVDDLDGLIKRTEDLLVDGRQRDRMGQVAAARAEGFHWPHTARRFAAVLETTLQGATQRPSRAASELPVAPALAARD